MRFPFNIFGHPLFPKENYIWVQVKIIHETKKAILISTDPKNMDPKIRDQESQEEKRKY